MARLSEEDLQKHIAHGFPNGSSMAKELLLARKVIKAAHEVTMEFAEKNPKWMDLHVALGDYAGGE